MSWRPKDWHTPNVTALADIKSGIVLEGDVKHLNVKEQRAYEAGANAILEALRDRETATTPFAREVWHQYFYPERGHVVFIPDE